MLELTRKGITDKAGFARAGIRVPEFDIDAVRKATAAAPVWVHLSAGNLFKAFHASLAQRIIEAGATDKGVIVAEPFDYEAVTKVFTPHDNLCLRVVMQAEGGLDKEVLASVTEALAADSAGADWGRLLEIFASPSLQMVSLSITEKGYGLRAIDGAFRPDILAQFDAGPDKPEHAMLKLCSLMLHRFKNGAAPVALVSTDNFSHNGDRLKEALSTAAAAWQERGFVGRDFLAYLADPAKVTFPLSMIDKITPYPAERVKEALAQAGLVNIDPVKTSKGALASPFVNTEETEYLVIEDLFPNGRPPLHLTGVHFTDRQTVDKVERMKVCTCLNPLHTALAVSGCLLGYDSIAAEMQNPALAGLVRKMAYTEGLPVVTDPGIIEPVAFLSTVLEKRLPNPNIPDTPQRIATDTSQKLGIRFGETIKLYAADPALGTARLRYIPLVIALWCRCLMALKDDGTAFEPSPDPLLAELRPRVANVILGKPETARDALRPILSNEKIFGVNLYTVGLGERIEGYFGELIAGPGAVKKTLEKYAAA
ncbi:MAG: mannitol dehydrogenase family protein [Treponema sp.]|jgi:fructuronate reductase|nr:mannitol dehydrogenase family protein [Treponema sp.]